MLTTFLFRRTTLILIRLLLAGLLLTTWAALPRSGYSAPEATVRYVAPGGSDSYPCTTAAKPCEHIQAAIDKSASGDTIQIAAGTYIEQLTIHDRNLTLTGKSAANTFLDGNQLYQILSLSRESTPSMTVSLSGVTLRSGKSTQPGGAIANDSNSHLTISNSNITNNTSSNGGGIFNNGFLKLINVTVSGNSATGLEGGGIYNVGNIELSGVRLTNNQAPNGGGISNRNALTITASSIVSNISNGGTDGGGGIYNVALSRLILVNSTLSGNKSRTNIFGGGAILNRGVLTGTGTTILNNESDNGGGIYNDTSGRATFSGGSIRGNTALVSSGGGLFNSGSIQIDKALITGNSAATTGGGFHNTASGKLTVGTSIISTNTARGAQGGGISNLGALTVTQSALVYNASSTSQAQGGGLNNAGTARLTNATISDNTAVTGSGIYNSGGTLLLQFITISNTLNNAGGSVTVGNSILAPGAGNACGGTITSWGYNLDSGASCGFSAANHDLASTNPQLGPLQDNGGGTLTRAISFSSPAVDSAGACPPPNADQRGIVRPQSLQQQPKCDRGAYEVVGYANFDPLDISASQCATRTMTINGKLFAIGRILAGVNLTHTNRSNLTIRLLSPGIPKVTLLGPAANTGQNLNTMFDDNAATATVVPAGNQLTSVSISNYVYKPSTPLSQLRGMGINGTWKLEICNAGAVKATLNYWVLVVPETTDFKAYLPIVKRG